MERVEDLAGLGRHFFVLQTVSWTFAFSPLAADGQER